VDFSYERGAPVDFSYERGAPVDVPLMPRTTPPLEFPRTHL